MLRVEVPLVPALTVRVPLLLTVPVPEMILEPETVRLTAVLAVRLLLKVMPFAVESSDSVPEPLPIAISAAVLMAPPAVTDKEVREAGAVPIVSV